MSRLSPLTRLTLCAAVASVVAVPLRAQGYELLSGASKTIDRDDYHETHVQGGFELSVPNLRLTIRGERLLLLNDLEAVRTAAAGGRSDSGLPTRGIPQPAPRRMLSNEEIQKRLDRALSAIGRTEGLSSTEASDRVLDVFRYLYCEGGIVVVQEGVEVVRCDRLWISPLDDRVVVEGAELRYLTQTGRGRETLVVRAPRLVKQGPRWVGTDVLLTSCTAGEPHAALAVGEVEIIERPGEFEVVARGQTLQIGGTSLVPVPDARFFTKSQGEFPIRSVSAGYSGLLGAQFGLVVGLPWNGTGGTLHELLTGRPAGEFRGEWELGVGWIEARGYPIDGAVTYRAPGVYEGRTEFFWLDDQGSNLREIRFAYDGSRIDETNRNLVRSQNRVFLGPSTHLDLVAFDASDAAVYPDFFIGTYRNDEVPETSSYLHHADGNHLLTIGTRFSLTDWSYRDDRALATRFVEELPVATYQWLAEPVAKTPWDTPIVLDLETQVGQRRSAYDDLSGLRESDRSLRADQHVELSSPFRIGEFSVRPYASGRGTFYDEALDRDSEARIAWEGGVQVGTRMSRTWSWLDEGKRHSVRHVVAPRVTYRNRFHVDDEPGDFFQYDFDPNAPFAASGPARMQQLGYDNVDMLSERELVRFELRNLLQHAQGGKETEGPRDFVFLDLAQDVFPNQTRDNDGETLGLFFYDLLLRPSFDWLPFENFAFAFYGDHDWRRGMQTLDTELQFGRVLGCNWTVEYREDQLFDGAIAIAARTRLMERWQLFAGSQRDLERDEWLAYSFGVRRDDHDWSIMLSANYNPFSDETTFRIEFLPRLGGLNQPRQDRFAGIDPRARYSFDY